MCGIICKFNKINLDLMQNIKHRGQESYGFSYIRNVSCDQYSIITEKFNGKINNSEVTDFYSKMIIGHCRYSTSGKSKKIEYEYDIQSEVLLNETQPISGKNILGEFKLIHNGNIPNIETADSISDSHIVLNLSTISLHLHDGVQFSLSFTTLYKSYFFFFNGTTLVQKAEQNISIILL